MLTASLVKWTCKLPSYRDSAPPALQQRLTCWACARRAACRPAAAAPLAARAGRTCASTPAGAACAAARRTASAAARPGRPCAQRTSCRRRRWGSTRGGQSAAALARRTGRARRRQRRRQRCGATPPRSCPACGAPRPRGGGWARPAAAPAAHTRPAGGARRSTGATPARRVWRIRVAIVNEANSLSKHAMLCKATPYCRATVQRLSTALGTHLYSCPVILIQSTSGLLLLPLQWEQGVCRNRRERSYRLMPGPRQAADGGGNCSTRARLAIAHQRTCRRSVGRGRKRTQASRARPWG